ncbi:hypothetical protein AMATHDRAFT_42952 [Amanita thiersii Skay4041]|uniref:DUF6534 domain-containing protein n=1 Tax=Amanita thiersii Skay4041 TaxID=703135 RepID=A0A2A9N9X0_9AGAR|nr:hypothetical protein AMATHDRAFT_42952 [Amanita thiersii Skay4041]
MQGAAELAMGIQLYIGTSDVVQEMMIIAKPVQLHQARKGSKLPKQTEDLVTKLIINTVETGAVTAVTACVELALFLANPNNYVYLVPAVILGKVYSNVLVANLNGRARMRTSVSDDPSMLVMRSMNTNALWGESASEEEMQTRTQGGIELAMGMGTRSFGTDTLQELSSRTSRLGGREKSVIVSVPQKHEEIELQERRGLEVKREESL